MSLAEFVVVFAVDANCKPTRKDTDIPQYGLFVLSMQCLGLLVHIHTCCPIAVPIES